MRKLVLTSALALLAACGSSSKGGHDNTAVTATIDGHTFTPGTAPGEIRAVTAATTSACSLAGQSVGVNAIGLEFASYGNLCPDLSSVSCLTHRSAQVALILLASLGTGATAPAITPGTYTLHRSAANVGPQNGLLAVVAHGVSLASDGTSCAATPVPVAEGGTLEITSISGGTITGYVDAVFTDNAQRSDTLKGAFTAQVCGTAPDICTVAGTALAMGLCTTAPASCQ